MGEFAAKYRPEINLDEFERRLRAAAPGPQSGSSSTQASQRSSAEGMDPLAELARLVGGESPGRKEDPFEALFRAQAAVREIRDAPAPVQGSSHAAREPHFGDQAQYHDFEQQDSRQRDLQPRAEQPSWQAGRQDRAQDRAPHGPAAQHDPYAESYGAQPAFAADPYVEAEPQWADDAAAPFESWPDPDQAAQYDYDNAPAAVAPGRKRKVATVMAFVLIAGVLGIGGTLALRGKSSGEIVTIQANSDPAKIKPDTTDAASGGASQTLFDRKADTAVAKVVSKSEQPADLDAAIKAARSVGPADAVPTPPAPSASLPAEQDTGLPPPKRVKTVSVRADGSIINGMDAKPLLARNMAPMAMGLPPAASAPPQSRKPPATRTPAAGSLGGFASSTTQAALQAPARPRPSAIKPATVVAVDHAVVPAAGSTGWAVQLSSSPSEAEARASASALSAKYAGPLQGRHATFVQAKKGDATIYRVRIGHLAEETAKSMCASIKSQGGGCFATKN